MERPSSVVWSACRARPGALVPAGCGSTRPKHVCGKLRGSRRRERPLGSQGGADRSFRWRAAPPPTAVSRWTSVRRNARRCSRCSPCPPGSAVPVTRLVELVWGDDPPRTAEKTLQSYVVRLRKGLGAEADRAYRGRVPPGRAGRQRRRGPVPAATRLRAMSRRRWGSGPELRWPGWTRRASPRWWTGWWSSGWARWRPTWTAASTPIRGGRRAADRAHRGPSVPRGAVVAADDRPVPGGAAGRCAGRVPAGPRTPRGAARGGTRPTAADLEARILAQDERLRGRPPRADRPAVVDPTGTVTFGFCAVAESSRLWATHRTKMAAAMVRLERADARRRRAEAAGTCSPPTAETFGAAFQRADDAAAWADRAAGGGQPRTVARWHGAAPPDRAAHRRDRGDGQQLFRCGGQLRNGHRGRRARRSDPGVGSDVGGAAAQRSARSRDLPAAGREHRAADLPARCRRASTAAGRDQPSGKPATSAGRLIGRDEDLEVIADALTRSPVVTLLGPGGIGKTRLAIAAAQRLDTDHAAAAWFVELAGIASSGDVARAVADTLGVADCPGTQRDRVHPCDAALVVGARSSWTTVNT